VGNALIPALFLLAVPLGILAAQLRLFHYRAIRYAGIAFLICLVILEFPEGVDDPSLNRFKMVLAGVLAVFFFLRHTGFLCTWSRAKWIGWLVAAAAASIILYTDFFRFHGTPGFAHWHEVAHYYLGSKYFPELGYGDLYIALARAEQEDAGALGNDRVARDLTTNRLVPARDLIEKSDLVKARFSPERWQSFRKDSALFRGGLGPHWPPVLVDHGYNPTPVWTLVGGPIANLVPAGDQRWMLRLTLLDPFLLILSAVAATWGFGIEAALLAICYFGVIFGTAFGWTGGAFLRVMWFAATICAVACLARRKHSIAGGLLAFATLLRIFPLFFAVPVALRAVGQLYRTGRIAPETQRFLAGFAGTLVGLFVASLVIGPGSSAWGGFARNSRVYLNNLGENLVGLSGLATVLVGSLTAAGQHLSEQLFDLRNKIQQIQLFVLLPLATAGVGVLANRTCDVKSAALGVMLIFAALNPAGYYFTFLILLVLAWPGRMDRLSLFFGVEFVTYILALFETQPAVLYFYRSALVFWLLVFLALDEARVASASAFPVSPASAADLTRRSALR
jgi:hypothetical protein